MQKNQNQRKMYKIELHLVNFYMSKPCNGDTTHLKLQMLGIHGMFVLDIIEFSQHFYNHQYCESNQFLSYSVLSKSVKYPI